MSHFDQIRSLGLGKRSAQPVKNQPIATQQGRQAFKAPPTMNKGMRRIFDAAKTDNHTLKWPTWPVHIDFILEYQQRTIVARSREQYANNDYVKNYMRVLRRNIVGPTGIMLQAKSRDANGELDKKANDAIEAAWDTWGEIGNCDVTGKLSWLDAQNLGITTLARDGEIFIRYIYGKSGSPYGFAIQLIDAQRCPVHLKRTGGKGENEIRNGVEFNQYGRPIAYYFSTEDTPEKAYWGMGDPALFMRVPAEQIEHVFLPEFVSQKRGIPWAVSSLYRLNQINRFEEAAVISARVGATKMGFFKRQYETAEEITQQAIKGGNGGGGAPPCDPQMSALGGAPGETGADPWNGEDDQAGFVLEGEPGTWESLPVGWEPVEWNPMYPSGEFDPFNKAQLRGAGVGMGVAYHTLSGDLSDVNFSSIRQGSLDERDEWMLLQTFFITNVNNKIYKKWLSYALLAGKIVLPNGSALNFTKYDKFSKVLWQGRRWQWIDPVKDATASTMALDKLITSPSQIIRESGRDPETVWEEYASDIEAMKRAGIPDELIVKFMSQSGAASGGKTSDESSNGDGSDGDADGKTGEGKPKKKPKRASNAGDDSSRRDPVS